MTQKPIKTGLIGHPVSHSKSPLIHNSWITQYDIAGEYRAIDLPCETLHAGIKNLIAEGYRGFNITVPHKVAILQLCEEVDALCRIVGAVNTVTIRDGKLFGTNTDVFGFTQNIKDNAPQFSFTAGKALVLGSGGAARAIVQGLIAEGVPEIMIANRTRANADALLAHTSAPNKIKIIPWEMRADKEHLHNVNLLVNTTSLGMSGKHPLDMSLEHLPAHALVNDIVYAPLYTDLLKSAQARGNPVVTGIGMLLHQARPAFHAWYGIMPEVSADLQSRVLA
jgi:shikimate dehydrogenase